MTKGDEGKDEESGVKEHDHCYSISAFKTIQKEILECHIDNGSRNMINKSSD